MGWYEMKYRWLLALALVPLLSGCSAPVTWETVDDPTATAPAAVEQPYLTTFGVPDDVAQPVSGVDGGNLYVQEDGDYEIYSEVLTASDKEAAIRMVSGFDAADLDIVETERFGLPEYRFAWVSASDEGNYVSQASVVEDGSYFYTLIFSVREEAGNQYADCAQAVFASFGVYGNEML